MTDRELTPERRMFDIVKKYILKAFYLIIAVIGYFQAFDYIKEKLPLNIEITDSKLQDGRYITSFQINNKNASIEKADFVRPIELILNNNINSLIINRKEKIKCGIQSAIDKNVLTLEFDLLNKNEIINFKTISDKELDFKTINFRIKDIDEISFYHFKSKPKPIKRILNFWAILLVLSIVLFIDALLVILKDTPLGKMKSFVNNFPLTVENKTEFLEKYRKLYSDYNLRLKPSEKFFIDFKIKNLLDSFEYNEKNIQLIRSMTNFYTEFFVMYRLRTIFVIISPILFIVSFLGILFNYFYFDIDFIKSVSLVMVNEYLLKILLLGFSIMIIFPRKTMNMFFIKKSARKSGDYHSF